MRPLRTRSRKVGRGRIIMAISKSLRADIDQGQFTVANSHRGCGISAVCGLPMRTNQMSRIYLGHNVYGLAAVIFGVITLAWRDLNAWREIMPFGKVTHPEILLYTAAAIELFGGFVVSFAVEQLAYLSATAELVPKWIPPGQLFWAIATTVAFGLAAFALLSRRSAPLASRLLTIMLVGFGLLVWLPIVVSDPHKLFNWTESALTLAIAGAAWIVADFLAQNRSVALHAP